MSRNLPRQTYLRAWDGDLPETGDYLKTASGAIYAIISTKEPRNGSTSRLVMWIWRLDPGEVPTAGKPVHGFRWLRS